MKKTTKKPSPSKQVTASKKNALKIDKKIGIFAIVAGLMCIAAFLLFIFPISDNSKVSKNSNSVLGSFVLRSNAWYAAKDKFIAFQSSIYITRNLLSSTVSFTVPSGSNTFDTAYSYLYVYEDSNGKPGKGIKSSTEYGYVSLPAHMQKRFNLWMADKKKKYCVKVESYADRAQTGITANVIAETTTCGIVPR